MLRNDEKELDEPVTSSNLSISKIETELFTILSECGALNQLELVQNTSHDQLEVVKRILRRYVRACEKRSL